MIDGLGNHGLMLSLKYLSEVIALPPKPAHQRTIPILLMCITHSVYFWQSFCKYLTFDTQNLVQKKCIVIWHIRNWNDKYYLAWVLRWHFKRKCRCQLTLIFCFWKCRLTLWIWSWTSMKFLKHTQWSPTCFCLRKGHHVIALFKCWDGKGSKTNKFLGKCIFEEHNMS